MSMVGTYYGPCGVRCKGGVNLVRPGGLRAGAPNSPFLCGIRRQYTRGQRPGAAGVDSRFLCSALSSRAAFWWSALAPETLPDTLSQKSVIADYYKTSEGGKPRMKGGFIRTADMNRSLVTLSATLAKLYCWLSSGTPHRVSLVLRVPAGIGRLDSVRSSPTVGIHLTA
jgi:hypothetical protein